MEFGRARRALAFLKARIGNDAMRVLLKDDLDASAARVRTWLEASNGEWTSGTMTLVVPGLSAAAFHAWFMKVMKEARETDLRAGHPEHFLNHPMQGHAEVIENVGEDDGPWYLKLDFTPPDASFPTPWDPDFTERLGVIINDVDGNRIGSAIHEMRDAPDGMHVKLTIHLPKAVPHRLVLGHLRHFCVEWRNWSRLARSES
jgi:hypothetical protein